jgi:ribonuclease HII
MPGAPDLVHETAAWSAGTLLIGVDEVGRGPLAGPVVAAAVVFPPHSVPVEGVRDSKTLSARQRQALVPLIRARAAGLGVGAASVREIDRFNIRRATALAIRRAVARLLAEGRVAAQTRASRFSGHRVLLDGLPLPECGLEHDALVDGDALCYTVAAAGIIAKEIRDELMLRLARRHPAYGWASNAGYGTAEHCAAIDTHGPTPHHRRSFTPVSQISLHL